MRPYIISRASDLETLISYYNFAETALNKFILLFIVYFIVILVVIFCMYYTLVAHGIEYAFETARILRDGIVHLDGYKQS